METLFIVLTTECNKDCPYCFYITGYQEKVESKLSPESISGFLDCLKKFGLRQVIFTGGEPFLCKDLFAALKISSEMGLHNLLITNGSFLSETIFPEIVESGVNAISVSVDSLEGESNKNLMQAIKGISGSGLIHVTLITPITRKNLSEIENIYKFSKSLSIGQIFQPAFIPEYNRFSEQLSLRNLNKDEWIILKKTLNQWAKDYGAENYNNLVFSFYEGKGTKPKKCFMGSDAFVLNANGDLFPCFHRKELVIGNIIEDRFDEILKNLNRFSNELSKAQCFGEHCMSLFTDL